IYYDRDILELHFIIPSELSESGLPESRACSGLYDAPLSASGMAWDDSFNWVLGDGDPLTRGSDELRVMKITSFSGFTFSQGHPVYLEARPLPEKAIILHHRFLPPDSSIPRSEHADKLEIRGFHTLLKTTRYRYSGYELTGYQLVKKGTSEPAGSFNPLHFTGQQKMLSFPSAFDAVLIYRPVLYNLQLFTEEGTLHTSRYHQERLFSHTDKNESASGQPADEFCIHDYEWFLTPLFQPQSQIDENSLMPAHPVTLFGKRKISLPEDPVITPPETFPDPEEKPDLPKNPETPDKPEIPDHPVTPPDRPEPDENPENQPGLQPEGETHPNSEPEQKAEEAEEKTDKQPESIPSTDSEPEDKTSEEASADPDPEKSENSLPSLTDEKDNIQTAETEDGSEPETSMNTISARKKADEAAPETADSQSLLLWLFSFIGSLGVLMRILVRRR
ncbi:MAG: hypothetical protein ACFNYI_06680, partial [Eubacterium sp.]